MKRPREVENTSLFDEILNETPQDVKNFVDNALEIAHQISVLMERKGLLQKDLANLLGKSEAEISRMLSGTHNLTIKSISKIEAVLDAKVITTPYRVEVEKIELKNSFNFTATANYISGIDLNKWIGAEVGENTYALAA
ncbi:MAG: helix-turn-helix domain-containing protein [Taibaiella sp.]|nr:helix-turn-helix domain-containing protein [Taibaiella sp.]